MARARAVLDQLLKTIPASSSLSGTTLLQPLSGTSWALEWNLPRWLGAPLGLPELVQEQLVIISALGLLALRVLDDARDGELSDHDPGVALAPHLLLEVRLRLARHLPSGHAFWSHYEDRLDEWRRAQSLAPRPGSVPKTVNALAAAGAPLQVSAAAVCCIAGREDVLPDLDRTIGCYLAAAVLLDHLKDWPKDLAAGRHNHFLTHLLAGQTPRSQPQMQALAWSEIAAGTAYDRYLERIDRLLAGACDGRRERTFPQLAGYLATLRLDARRTSTKLRRTACRALDDISRRLFVPPPHKQLV